MDFFLTMFEPPQCSCCLAAKSDPGLQQEYSRLLRNEPLLHLRVVQLAAENQVSHVAAWQGLGHVGTDQDDQLCDAAEHCATEEEAQTSWNVLRDDNDQPPDYENGGR